MNFYPWEDDEDDDSLAWIEENPDKLDQQMYKLKDGIPCADWFPPGQIFKLASGRGIRLADSIPNVLALVFASAKLKALLEKDSDARFEFLPIQIRDLKKRIVKAPYHIANLLDIVECVDKKRSDFEMQLIIKDQVDHFRRLVLDERKIPKGKKIFRLAEKTRLIIVREDLMQAIRDSGCTGAAFRNIEDFGALFRP